MNGLKCLTLGTKKCAGPVAKELGAAQPYIMSQSNINVRVCVCIYIYMHVCRLCWEIDFCACQGMRDIKANYAVCCAFVLILNKQAGEDLLGIHCNQYYCKVSLEAHYWE